LSEESEKYKDAQFAHEAGFDAYMTGCIFLKLVHQLEKNYHSTKEIVESRALIPLQNKFTIYGSVIPFSIVGTQAEMDFSRMFHVSGLPTTAGTPELLELFQDFKPIEVKWLESGAIVMLRDKEKANSVMPALKKSKYKVVPYAAFKLRERQPQSGEKKVESSLWLYAGAAIPVIIAGFWYLFKK